MKRVKGKENEIKFKTIELASEGVVVQVVQILIILNRILFCLIFK